MASPTSETNNVREGRLVPATCISYMSVSKFSPDAACTRSVVFILIYLILKTKIFFKPLTVVVYLVFPSIVGLCRASLVFRILVQQQIKQ